MTATAPTAGPPPPGYTTVSKVRHRPLGVTLLAILHLLLGLLLIISAIGAFALAGYVSMFTIPPEIEQNIPQWFIDFAPIALAIAGVVILVVGLISILITWGFLKGRNWSRILAIVIFLLIVIVNVFNTIVAAIFTPEALLGLIIAIVIPVLIIWYLTTRKVKEWFRPDYYVRQP